MNHTTLLSLKHCLSLTQEEDSAYTIHLAGHPKIVTNRLLRLIPNRRAIFRAMMGETEVIVKLFFDKQHAKRHARKEIKGLQALAQMEIKTPSLLFAGTLQGAPGIEVIVTEFVDAPKLLDIWHDLSEAQQSTLFNLIVSHLARCHDNGFTMTDAHFNNFLLQGDELITLDGGAVVPLTRAPILKTLTQCSHVALTLIQLSPGDDKQAAQALDGYLSKRHHPNQAWRRRLISHLIALQRFKKARRLARKACRHSTRFTSIKTKSRLAFIHRAYDSPTLRAWIAHPDYPIDDAQMLKDGNSTTVVKSELDGHAVVIKRYNPKRGWQRIKQLGPSRARRAWVHSHYLQSAQINTPQPIAMIEMRNGLRCKCSYFIYAYTPGDNLQTVFNQQLIPNLQHLFKQLRHARLSHGDLKASNCIVANDTVSLIDVDAVKLHALSPSHRRALVRAKHRFLENFEDTPELLEKVAEQLDT